MQGKNLQIDCNDMRDQISEWWNDLSEEDLNMINGDQEQLINLLQDRYGYTRNIAFLACIELRIRMAGSVRNQKRAASLV